MLWKATRTYSTFTTLYFLWWPSICNRNTSLRPYCCWNNKGRCL